MDGTFHEFRLFEKRLVIVMGKGGVGKTTVASAIALLAARRGSRTLLMELHTRPRAAHLFGCDEPAAYEPRPLLPNLWVCHVSPEEAMIEYGLMKLRFRRLYDLVFENDLMKRLVRMVPGMNDLLLLGKVVHAESECEARSRRPRWDFIVVDAPATGHGVSMLRLPHVILEVVRSGPLAEEARRMRDRITDPARTCLNIVTLPEETPVREAEELRAQLDRLLLVPPGYLFINAVYPATFDETEERCLEAMRDAARGRNAAIEGLVACNLSAVRRRRLQEQYIERLERRYCMPIIEVPYLFTPEFRLEALERAALAIGSGIERHEMRQAGPAEEAARIEVGSGK